MRVLMTPKEGLLVGASVLLLFAMAFAAFAAPAVGIGWLGGIAAFSVVFAMLALGRDWRSRRQRAYLGANA